MELWQDFFQSWFYLVFKLSHSNLPVHPLISLSRIPIPSGYILILLHADLDFSLDYVTSIYTLSIDQRHHVSVQFSCSVVSDSLWPHGLQHTRLPCPSSTPGVYPNSCPLGQWCHPTISSSVTRPLLLLPSIFSSIRVFSNESALCIRWPKYWSFSFNISPSNEQPGLISFRMDWLDLLAVQGTPKSLLQHHSSKASILWHSAFFIVQLSHPYVTTGKTIALTRWTFVGKVMSLLFNMLSRLVITLLECSDVQTTFLAFKEPTKTLALQSEVHVHHYNAPII